MVLYSGYWSNILVHYIVVLLVNCQLGSDVIAAKKSHNVIGADEAT